MCPGRAGGALDPDRDRLAGRVLHLAGDRALPDQVVEPELVALEAGALGLLRGAEAVARRADRLVRLLRVLHLAGVGPRRVRHVLGPVELAGLVAGGVDRARAGGVGVGSRSAGGVVVLPAPP